MAAKENKRTFTTSPVCVTASTSFEENFVDDMTAMPSEESQTRNVPKVVTLNNVTVLASLLPNTDVSPAGLQSNYQREEVNLLQVNPVKDQICCLINFVVSGQKYF